MHTRRLAAILLGIYLGLAVAMLTVATQNFAAVDRLLAAHSDEAEKVLVHLDAAQRRAILRYHSSELNRYYFPWYLAAQTWIGAALLLLFALGRNGNRVALICMLIATLLVLFQRYSLTPEIEFLGRGIDFIPPDVSSPARSRFWTFHNLFSGVEVLKLLVVATVCLKLMIRGDTRRRGAAGSDLRTETVEIR